MTIYCSCSQSFILLRQPQYIYIGVCLCALSISSAIYLSVIIVLEASIREQIEKSVRGKTYKSGFMYRYTQLQMSCGIFCIAAQAYLGILPILNSGPYFDDGLNINSIVYGHLGIIIFFSPLPSTLMSLKNFY